MKPNPASGLPPVYLAGYKEATIRYKQILAKRDKELKELEWLLPKPKRLRPIPLGKPKQKGIWRQRMDLWAQGYYHSRAEIERYNTENSRWSSLGVTHFWHQGPRRE